MDYVERDLAHIWHPASQMKDYEDFPPIIIDHAKGVKLYDVDGKEYIDIISSWWCNKGIIELAESLNRVTPENLTKFSFVDNGSSSVESALKMAFQYCQQNGKTEKKRFMCFTDAYHGETLGSLSVGALDDYSKVFEPIMLDTVIA